MESGNQPSIFKDLLVTHTMGNHIHDTTKWTRFISIVFIVCLSLFLILGIVAGTVVVEPVLTSSLPGWGVIGGNLILVIAIIFFLLFAALAFFLLRFAIFARRGLEMRNQTLFNEGLKSLKIYFIIYGVFSILSLLTKAFSLLSL